VLAEATGGARHKNAAGGHSAAAVPARGFLGMRRTERHISDSSLQEPAEIAAKIRSTTNGGGRARCGQPGGRSRTMP
jgi:hypothetical protein